MKGKELCLQNPPVSETPIIPDQVLAESEVKYEEADAVMAGCPGYEWLDEPSPPNWPPKKGIILSLRELISGISFAIKYPYADRAFRNLEKGIRKK